MSKIAIIGAGIIGLSSAVNILERYPYLDVTVMSEKFSPNTTGDVSAGLWGPYIIENTPTKDILRWSNNTHNFFHELWVKGLAEKTGICLQPVTIVAKKKEDLDPYVWKKVTYGCQEISDKGLEKLNKEHKNNYVRGYNFVSYTCEPIRMLPYLQERFLNAGGKIMQRKVTNLQDLYQEYDVILNCTGLGAKSLIGDNKMYAVRGQIARVKAPWQFNSFVEETDGHYVITNIDTVVLGGTSQRFNEDTNVKKKDSKHIFEECYKIVPGLTTSPVIKEYVGLRPGRSSVRLEHEKVDIDSRRVHVIHNYGHGGSGVTLCWGCGQDATQLLAKALDLPFSTTLQCKI